MKSYTQTLSPDELFSQEVKELFLQIPHKTEKVHPKLEIIDFDVPENGRYPALGRVNMVRLLEPLTPEEQSDFEVRKHLHGSHYGYHQGEDVGLYIASNHGSVVEDFIKELYKHDPVNSRKLREAYQDFATSCSDVTSIEERFIRQLSQLKAHLVEENYTVKDLGIDYEGYEKKSEDEQIEFIDSLYEKFGDGYNFPAYNDLDYTPYMVKDDLYMYDSSGARLYVVKNEKDSQKIYMLNKDNITMEDAMRDFAYSHHQGHLLLARRADESCLIGEIKDKKLVKASHELTIFDMMQGYIVEELYTQGKIKNTVPHLSFEDLLDNYTLQKESYQMKERALLKIFSQLQLADGNLTYEGYSAMPQTSPIRHEDFAVHAARNLQERFGQSDTLKMSALPQEYKDQIDSYLTTLAQTYDNPTTHTMVEFLRGEMASTAKKLKRR